MFRDLIAKDEDAGSNGLVEYSTVPGDRGLVSVFGAKQGVAWHNKRVAQRCSITQLRRSL